MTATTEIPRYELLAPFYAENDTLYPEGTEFEYNGQCNEFMRPLNEAARQRMAEYLPNITRKPLDVQISEARERERTRPVPVIPAPNVAGVDKSAPLVSDPNKREHPRAALVGDAKAPAAGVQRGPKKAFGSLVLEKGTDARNPGGYGS